MNRYFINVNNGDANITKQYCFVHHDWDSMSVEDQDAAFDKAVKELNHIYKDYGRFATTIGVIRLFESFGFELSLR